MSRIIVLDTTPFGIATAGVRNPEAQGCRKWIQDCISNGVRVCLPEIADYELRRELLRTNAVGSIRRLDILKSSLMYVPITTKAMLKAAELWAQSRNAGVVTADKHALDGDIILVAQALILEVSGDDIIVATINVRHISQFIAADIWSNIPA
jgi:predicted nucleic acid-binding protein